jgi:para-nitrobenzyl esterase
VFFSLFGPADVFRIDEAGLRNRLSGTYQGAELDRIINTFRKSRPGATPAQLYFAITTSPIWRDAIKIAEARGGPARGAGVHVPAGLRRPHRGAGHRLPARLAARLRHPHQVRQRRQRCATRRRATARYMSALWAGFAHTGRPTATDVPRWPSCTPRDRATMWIDARCRIVNDPDKAERLYWQKKA